MKHETSSEQSSKLPENLNPKHGKWKIKMAKFLLKYREFLRYGSYIAESSKSTRMKNLNKRTNYHI